MKAGMAVDARGEAHPSCQGVVDKEVEGDWVGPVVPAQPLALRKPPQSPKTNKFLNLRNSTSQMAKNMSHGFNQDKIGPRSDGGSLLWPGYGGTIGSIYSTVSSSASLAGQSPNLYSWTCHFQNSSDFAC